MSLKRRQRDCPGKSDSMHHSQACLLNAASRVQTFPSPRADKGANHRQGAMRHGDYLGPPGDLAQSPTELGQGLCILQAPRPPSPRSKILTSTEDSASPTAEESRVALIKHRF